MKLNRQTNDMYKDSSNLIEETRKPTVSNNLTINVKRKRNKFKALDKLSYLNIFIFYVLKQSLLFILLNLTNNKTKKKAMHALYFKYR